MVATLSKADELAIISTAPGLIDMRGTGEIVRRVEKITPEIRAMAGGTTSATAVGGMITKIKAAEIATSSGCDVYIASGVNGDSLSRIFAGENPGTVFIGNGESASSRKRWLAHFGRTIGKIFVDEGAAEAIHNKGSSLLPAGVKDISGKFSKGDLVEIVDVSKGYVVARGLAAENSDNIKKMVSAGVRKKCGHKDVVVHRDNLAIV